jgi:hypothetical protein
MRKMQIKMAITSGKLQYISQLRFAQPPTHPAGERGGGVRYELNDSSASTYGI